VCFENARFSYLIFAVFGRRRGTLAVDSQTLDLLLWGLNGWYDYAAPDCLIDNTDFIDRGEMLH
jgi:hypothetical protein